MSFNQAPSQGWNPSMIYRPERTRDQTPTILEQYGESNILSLFRFYLPMREPLNLPNFDFGPMIEAAANICEKIDMFDNNEGLLDQVIFGIACPELCHAGIKDITKDRELIALLLVRHFKSFGGLVLPPLAAARELQEAHDQVVRQESAAGREMSQMHYPNWRQAQMPAAPPGLSLTSTWRSMSRGRRVGGHVGRGLSSRGVRGGGY